MITREISIAKGKNVIHSLVFYPIRDPTNDLPHSRQASSKGKNVIHSLWFYPIRYPTNDLPHSRQASSKGKMSYIVLCFTQ